MSIVGPRPLLVQYLDRYTPLQARRHEVRPGITGLAQVSGRNALSWEEKFTLDVEYVDTSSVATDARIFWGTIAAVFRRHGISAAGEATMGEFDGDGHTVQSAVSETNQPQLSRSDSSIRARNERK